MDEGLSIDELETTLLKEWIYRNNEDALLADGFEDAVIGMCESFGKDRVVAYDTRKCLEILMDRDGMSFSEAAEFFEFNVLGAYVGDNTPVYIWTKP